MTDDQVLADVLADVPAWKAHARVYAVKAWNQDVAQLSRAREKLVAEDNTDSMAIKLDGILTKQKALTDAGPEPYYNDFVATKVAAHRAKAEAAFALPGYKNRAEREAQAEAERQAKALAAEKARVEAEAAKQVEFDAAVLAAARRLKDAGVI